MKYLAAAGALLFVGIALGEVDKWAWTTNYESSIELSCNNSQWDYKSANNITWIIPDKNGEGVSKGWADETREVTGTHGELMQVKKVKPSNSGIYTCLIHMNGNIYSVKRGLNLAGPSVDDLWKKYETNVMIGGIAAGSCLGFFIIACLIYKFRYKEPGRSKFSDTGFNMQNSYRGKSDNDHVYDNPVDVTKDEKVAASNGAAGSDDNSDTRM